MGAPKQKWTSEEEEALRRGVLKHGAGKWRTIQKDPEFSPVLSSRSNIDLKDKWRNLSLSASGFGSREKIKLPKIKSLSPSPSPCPQALLLPAPHKVAEATPLANPEKGSEDGKTPPRYGAMIIEALAAMQEPNGSEIGAIFSFIEQKHEVPPNFRRLLSSKLRRLVAQNKIEKADKAYRLKDSSATKTPVPKQKDPSNRSKASQNSPQCTSTSPAEEAAIAAAYMVAEAEAKAYLASEAVKEAERVQKMADENDALLMLATEIYERCSRGEVIIIDQFAERDS